MVRQRRHTTADAGGIRRPSSLVAVFAIASALAVAAAACTSDEPNATGRPGASSATSIEVAGPGPDGRQNDAIRAVLGAWGAERDIEVTYLADADWEASIQRRVDAGDPPNISLFPNLDLLAALARRGLVTPLGETPIAAAAGWSDAWTEFGLVDGTPFAVPVESDLNSLVWFQPAAFARHGYDVPATFGEFTDLVATMAAADGPKPLCVGIQSGQSTGWVYAEWVADVVLQQHGPVTYDQWISNDIAFDDPRIVESMQTVLDLWSDDNVFASEGTIVSTPFQDNADPLVNGDCFMHRQGSFFSIFFPDDTTFADGTPASVDVFAFPNTDVVRSTLGSVTVAAGFTDDPNVQSLLAYLATPAYADARRSAESELGFDDASSSNFLSAANGQDLAESSALQQRLVSLMQNAETVRRDVNQALPAEVIDVFWTAGASAVAGDATAANAAAAVEAAWID